MESSKSAKKSKKDSEKHIMPIRNVDSTADASDHENNRDFQVKIIEKTKAKKSFKEAKIESEDQPNLVVESISENTIATTSKNAKEKESSIFSEEKFDDLTISATTKTALRNMGFIKMTLIQAKSIPDCLAGKDLVGSAKTGSGKHHSSLSIFF